MSPALWMHGGTFRFLWWVLAIVLLAAVGEATYIHFASEHALKRFTRGPAFDHPVPVDEEARERGRHLARTRGCFGCHGQQLEGLVFTEEWDWVERAVAPNLARHAREHDAATIEAAVRQGIGHDGRALWSMPSYNWANLSDADMADLIAFLRNAPVVDKQLPEPRMGWPARMDLAKGKAQHMADWVDASLPLRLQGQGGAVARGEYLAMTTCNECHGFDLRGNADPMYGTPDLAILTAYTDDEFRTLMKTGVTRDGRSDVPLMSMVARDRFAHFTERELDDLLAFLRTLPGQPVDRDAPWRELR